MVRTEAEITAAGLPRISKTLTVAELKYEADCRGYVKVPKKKTDLLELLGVGSLRTPTSNLMQTAACAKSKEHAKAAAAVKTKATAAKPPPPNASVYPRIDKKLTLAELRFEAACRGIEKKLLPKLKAELLDFLVDGSIHLARTDEWEKVQVIKDLLESDRFKVLEDATAIKQKKELDAELPAQTQREKLAQEYEDRRFEQRPPQTPTFTPLQRQGPPREYSFPRVHRHPIIRVDSIDTGGVRRGYVCTKCDTNCETGSGCDSDDASTNWDDDDDDAPSSEWICETCDIGFCTECFESANTKVENVQPAGKQEEMNPRKREMEENELKWNASKQFQSAIVEPLDARKSPSRSNVKGFTVWCSESNSNSRYHDESETMEFDTTWSSIEDANDRARYLFYWRNCWSVDPELVDGQGRVDESITEGLVTFEMEHCDVSWQVGVVPDIAFKYMPEATTCRHDYDQSPLKQRGTHDF